MHGHHGATSGGKSFFLFFFLMLAGCSDNDGQLCHPGQNRACDCGNGNLGHQICREDGRGWEDCTDCGGLDASTQDGQVGDAHIEDAGDGTVRDAKVADGGPRDATSSDGGTCDHPCSEEGKRHCTTTGFVECRRLGSGCLTWQEVACPAGQTCSTFFAEGGLVRCSADCDDECYPANGWGRCEQATERDSSLWMQCGDYDDDICNDFVVRDICDQGEFCANDAGCVTCLDECDHLGARGCLDNLTAVECGNFDDDDCLEYQFTTCGQDEACNPDTGLCECIDGCFVEDAVSCNDYYSTKRCGDFDADGCLEWGNIQQCNGSDTCQNGICSSTCTNECRSEGVFQCFGSSSRHICGYWDTDSCLDWTPIEECPEGLICSIEVEPGNDPCVQCDSDGRQCMPELEVCRDFQCVPPPGDCFQPDADTPLAITIPTNATISKLTLFLGFTDTLDTDSPEIRLANPSGQQADVVDCFDLPWSEVFWDTFDSDENQELAQFLGQPSQGTWSLILIQCSPQATPTLERWAICLEYQ